MGKISDELLNLMDNEILDQTDSYTQPMQRSDWITPRKVIHEFAAENGGPGALRNEIERRLRDGQLRACAKYVWESSERRLDRAFKNEPTDGFFDSTKRIERFVPITIDSWRKSLSWLNDTSDWHWDNSWFFVTIAHKPRRRLMFRKVLLNKVDVKSFFDPNFRGDGKRPAGRPRNEEAWRNFWHEICKMVSDGRIKQPEFASNEKLAKHLFGFPIHSPQYDQCLLEAKLLRQYLGLSRLSAQVGGD